MSRYDVAFTARATADFDAALKWYERQSPSAARRWATAVEAALNRLEQSPLQLPMAREALVLEAPLRELAFGAGRRPSHRMIYAVRELRVVVYAIRHVAQDAINLGELLGEGE